jgi:hypothetical protein
MPMLMLKCKTCGEVFPGIYLAEDKKEDLVSKLTKSDIPHLCSRGHENKYAPEDYMDWSSPE